MAKSTIHTKDQKKKSRSVSFFLCYFSLFAHHSFSLFQLYQVAFITHGFVGGDLATLLSNATSALLVETEGTGQVLSYDGVMRALDHVKPSAMRQVLVEVPNVSYYVRSI
jgi:hypothetical protein